MKCSLKSNIIYLALFLAFCLANCIIIENNTNNINNVLSKPENLKLIKIFEIKRVAENELKVLKERKEKLERSMKRLDAFDNNTNGVNQFSFVKLFNDNFPIIISLSALSIGFIFAGIFMIVAFLISE